MATTFQKADRDMDGDIARIMSQYHPDLADAGVRVGVIFALNPEGPAVAHGGYPALAKIKIVTLKDRLTKGYDAELLIDETEWHELRPDQRAALLDHELSHLQLVPMSDKELKAVHNDNPNAPTWKLDDLGRPRLKTRPGDWNAGDGFAAVVERHGISAVEYHNIDRAKGLADAARLRGEPMEDVA